MQLKLLRSLKRKVNEAEISSLQVVLWFAFPFQAPICSQQSTEELPAKTAILAGALALLLNAEPLPLQANPSPAAKLKT